MATVSVVTKSKKAKARARPNAWMRHAREYDRTHVVREWERQYNVYGELIEGLAEDERKSQIGEWIRGWFKPPPWLDV